ncbi:MAG: translation initiation factor IF-5A [Candidatus Aenigmarchaeota archaeon]|nr:translation initiation factor IF-5A [Candidatus Aenigmarchaeota archaeon]
MEKRQSEIKDLKPGSFVLIDEIPCKVDSVQISRPGKHGSSKARLAASGIFDNQKRIIVKPAGAKIDVPIIEKKSMQVIAIIGSNVQLMDLVDFTTTEVPIPEELLGQLTEGEEVLVWKFGSYIMLKGKKG